MPLKLKRNLPLILLLVAIQVILIATIGSQPISSYTISNGMVESLGRNIFHTLSTDITTYATSQETSASMSPALTK